ncbi:ABC-three component system protein [Methylocystis sp. JAN1]|uniref:ABC-three component system protein n=1 Tax=Methylocystis sp. JAN1 TaxID=3397211 RepID=UPI003FA257BD
MAVAQIEKPKTSVPGQYLGYALQPVRLCFHLLDAPNDADVSMEHLDDIAVHYADGTHMLEQTKSALSGNPASDRSVELWKAMANWADLCVAGAVGIQSTRFRYYVTPSAGGALVGRMHSAQNKAAVEDVLKEIASAKIKGKPESTAYPHIARFLAAGDEICRGIIASFELVVVVDPLDAIRGKLQALLPPSMLDDFVKAAIGIAKAAADELIREKCPPILSPANFRNRFRAFVMKHNLAGLLEPTTGAPSTDQIAHIIDGAPLFVRQLAAIEASQQMLVTAVSDWLRTTADKINWAAAGSIVEQSIDELDTSLERHHTLVADEIADTLSAESPSVRGRAIYRRCAALQMPLEGRTLPLYFIPGEFNDLADDTRLGWHPDHKTLFPKT